MENHTDPRFLFSLLDLTTLESTDTALRISAITEKVVRLYQERRLHPAAVCTYPVFSRQVKAQLKGVPVHIAAVSGGFPSGQTFPGIKMQETALAVSAGADEIDMVINRGRFLEEDLEYTFNEIVAVKNACGPAQLKVIIETGELRTDERIITAAEIAVKAGADFVKTSTGKSAVSATPEAARAICEVLRRHYDATGKKAGFKAAGGVAAYEDALVYADIVKQQLGGEWLTPSLFRIGASRLANDLLKRMGIADIVF